MEEQPRSAFTRRTGKIFKLARSKPTNRIKLFKEFLRSGVD